MKHERSAYIGCGYSLAALILLLLLVLMMASCKTVKYMPVVEHHTETITKHDSIIQRDTILDHQQTIIREVDSATMAQYGIQLKDMQRAWLIQTDRLQKQVSELMQSKNDSVIIRDSIPVPYQVTVEVPAKLNWWQRFRIGFGDLVLILAALWMGIKLLKKNIIS